MLTCPMCKKPVAVEARQCPRCTTDLSLLTDFLVHRQDGLTRAESLTRSGKLGDAVWAYLEVLEVDPENRSARQQVGQVVSAVRHFDRAAPARRWLDQLRKRERFRHWLDTWNPGSAQTPWLMVLLGLAVMGVSFTLGYYLGSRPVP